MVESGLVICSAHLIQGQDRSGSLFCSFSSQSRLVWQFVLLIQFMVKTGLAVCSAIIQFTVKTGLAVCSAHSIYGQDWSGSLFCSVNSRLRSVGKFVLLI